MKQVTAEILKIVDELERIESVMFLAGIKREDRASTNQQIDKGIEIASRLEGENYGN